MNTALEIPKLLTKSDMATRWGVSRQAVNNWKNRHDDFPKPVTTVDNGRLPLYLETDVIKYETDRNLTAK